LLKCNIKRQNKNKKNGIITGSTPGQNANEQASSTAGRSSSHGVAHNWTTNKGDRTVSGIRSTKKHGTASTAKF